MIFHQEKKRQLKPALKWAGGKTGLIPQLLRHFPTSFERYLEPFLGGGAVFFALAQRSKSIVNDLNPEITNLYEVIRDEPVKLMQALDVLSESYSEVFYYELRAAQPRNRVAKAARTLFLNKTCFNGLYRQNSRGEFNVPFGKRSKVPKLYDAHHLAQMSRALRKTKLLNQDFEKVIDLAKEGDFVYCDPPYEPLSSTSSFNHYTSRGFSKKEQERLWEACNRAVSRGALVAVSNSDCPFIRKLFKNWKIVVLNSRRSINSRGTGRGLISEVLAKSF